MKTTIIHIIGIVQGVGFRPFIYRLAQICQLNGIVYNHPKGVTVELQGDDHCINNFLQALPLEAPPLSRIDSVQTETAQDRQIYSDFTIVESRQEGKPSTLISPDVCVCDDCLREMFDSHDRRYLYPFINCTHCGPRYTIIKQLPYDRPGTTMKPFALCGDCQIEYTNPLDRRFHAQPNACSVCGPRLKLWDAQQKEVTGDPVEKVIALLQQGKIVAIKSLGGFHLAVDATNDAAVRRLRERKGRDEKPFAVMIGNLTSARQLANISPQAETLLQSRERPIVLIRGSSFSHSCDREFVSSCVRKLSASIAPHHHELGLILPPTPLHYLIFFHPHCGGDFLADRPVFPALVMTSGNIRDEPIIKDDDEALPRLRDVADAILTHDRVIHVRCDDSVLRATATGRQPIRRARGYAPSPINLKNSSPQILAVGPELKNTICLTDENRAFVSPHIGDLENVPTLDYFAEAVNHFQTILDLHPNILAYDLHPEYLSTKYVHEQKRVDLVTVGVQHHFAHIASVMAEKQIDEPVIGLALDGTGYGTDGTIWGGEVLLCHTTHFRRAAHLRPLPMPGGSLAIKENWRMAFAYLRSAFGDAWQTVSSECLKQISQENLLLLDQAITANINAPFTSSLGRLFDAVASLLDIKHRNAFEGQAPMMLEAMATNGHPQFLLPFDITEQNHWAPVMQPTTSLNIDVMGSLPEIKTQIIDYSATIRTLVTNWQKGVDRAELAMAFHQTIVQSLTQITQHISQATGITTVVLSGGSWQNQILMQNTQKKMRALGYKVLTNELIPVNDGGVSLGQAFVASSLFGTKD
ncbi:MAG: hypothetical protein ACD_62C00339G0005 [uncultured bacterium]|nr:MAG: hypothetical protein ACD_62C00339G0005 [uncultured bacterium]